MRNLLLTISYKGTNYHGFQVQQNAITVSEVIQKAIELIVGHKIEMKGCSRTDAGVHANVYCLSFKTSCGIMGEKLVKAINFNLPNDIAVLKCEEVNSDFHARYNCIKKEYIYKIWNAEYPTPFLFDTTYYYKYHLDEQMLNKQAKSFIGKHNFKAFCNYKNGKNMDDCVRTIYDFDVIRNGQIVIFKVCGDGFLYNMVRIMVGTLIFISEGKIERGKIPYIILSENRKLAGKTISAKGLYLNNIYY